MWGKRLGFIGGKILRFGYGVRGCGLGVGEGVWVERFLAFFVAVLGG